MGEGLVRSLGPTPEGTCPLSNSTPFPPWGDGDLSPLEMFISPEDPWDQYDWWPKPPGSTWPANLD